MNATAEPNVDKTILCFSTTNVTIKLIAQKTLYLIQIRQKHAHVKNIII